MTADDTVYTDTKNVICDGKSQDNGHPRIYLSLLPKGEAVCPYCSRKFILEAKKADA